MPADPTRPASAPGIPVPEPGRRAASDVPLDTALTYALLERYKGWRRDNPDSPWPQPVGTVRAIREAGFTIVRTDSLIPPPSIPVPEGWQAVEWRVPVEGETWLRSDGGTLSYEQISPTPRLVLERTPDRAPAPGPADQEDDDWPAEVCWRHGVEGCRFTPCQPSPFLPSGPVVAAPPGAGAEEVHEPVVHVAPDGTRLVESGYVCCVHPGEWYLGRDGRPWRWNQPEPSQLPYRILAPAPPETPGPAVGERVWRDGTAESDGCPLWSWRCERCSTTSVGWRSEDYARSALDHHHHDCPPAAGPGAPDSPPPPEDPVDPEDPVEAREQLARAWWEVAHAAGGPWESAGEMDRSEMRYLADRLIRDYGPTLALAAAAGAGGEVPR